jgi:hypothetical protein
MQQYKFAEAFSWRSPRRLALEYSDDSFASYGVWYQVAYFSDEDSRRQSRYRRSSTLISASSQKRYRFYDRLKKEYGLSRSRL